jgi:2-polyprenyl-3-methyl-5-hydroxy-6-metoxy-1,4-benzoquinol methylase
MTDLLEGREVPQPLCPLCRGDQFVEWRFSLVRCKGCGLIVNPALFRRGAGQELNEEAFGEGWEPETSCWVRWFQIWKNRRYLRTIRQVVQGGRLLKVGVGGGRFLEQARAAGFDVMGCDLSPAVCQRVEERIGVPVHCGSVDGLPRASFGVVAMHHVLEHVEDPVGFLRSVRALLMPGGIVHIAVPNVGSWEARVAGWNCYAPYHLTYFDRETLARAAREARLVPLWDGTHESFSTWFLTMVRMVLKARPNETPRIAASIGRVPAWWSLVEHPYRLAMVAAGVVTWPLRRVQGTLGRGDELVMVARAES